MFNEPQAHEEMRTEIIKRMKEAGEVVDKCLPEMESDESRLVFLREYYLPVIRGLAEALGHIKP